MIGENRGAAPSMPAGCTDVPQPVPLTVQFGKRPIKCIVNAVVDPVLVFAKQARASIVKKAQKIQEIATILWYNERACKLAARCTVAFVTSVLTVK